MLETLDSEIIQGSRCSVWIQPWPSPLLSSSVCLRLDQWSDATKLVLISRNLVNSWWCKKNRINSNSKNPRKTCLRCLFTANSRKMRMLIFQCRCSKICDIFKKRVSEANYLWIHREFTNNSHTIIPVYQDHKTEKLRSHKRWFIHGNIKIWIQGFISDELQCKIPKSPSLVRFKLVLTTATTLSKEGWRSMNVIVLFNHQVQDAEGTFHGSGMKSDCNQLYTEKVNELRHRNEDPAKLSTRNETPRTYVLRFFYFTLHGSAT